jgi:hypothetical protein
MQIHENYILALINENVPLSDTDGYTLLKKYWDNDLRCGVYKLQDPEYVVLFREVLTANLITDPQLQILIKSDQLVPSVVAFIPNTFRAYSEDSYVKFLIHKNPPFQQFYFEFTGSEVIADKGHLLHFDTCQQVVDYIVSMDFLVPHYYDKTKFDKEIRRGLELHTLTRNLQDPGSMPFSIDVG